jgi:hypothetical protein
MTFKELLQQVSADLARSHPEATETEYPGWRSWKRGPYEASVARAAPPYDIKLTLLEHGKDDRLVLKSFSDNDVAGAICRAIAAHLGGPRD